MVHAEKFIYWRKSLPNVFSKSALLSISRTYDHKFRTYDQKFVRTHSRKLSSPIGGTAGTRQASAISLIRIDVIRLDIELPEREKSFLSSIVSLRDGLSQITGTRTMKMIPDMAIFEQQFLTKLKKYVICDRE